MSNCPEIFIFHTSFTRIHTSSPINTKKILNTPIAKICSGDDVNMVVAELQLTKTRSPSCYKKYNII